MGNERAFHIAPGGDDRNPGTAEAPFQTIERARDAVREICRNMAGDIVVIFAPVNLCAEPHFGFRPPRFRHERS